MCNLTVEYTRLLKYPTTPALRNNLATPPATTSSTQIVYINLPTSPQILSLLFSTSSALISVFYAFVSGLALLSLCFAHVIYYWSNKRLDQLETQRTMIQRNLDCFTFHVEEAKKKIGTMTGTFQGETETTNNDIDGVGCYKQGGGRASATDKMQHAILKRINALENEMLQTEDGGGAYNVGLLRTRDEVKTSHESEATALETPAYFYVSKAANHSESDNPNATTRCNENAAIELQTRHYRTSRLAYEYAEGLQKEDEVQSELLRKLDAIDEARLKDSDNYTKQMAEVDTERGKAIREDFEKMAAKNLKREHILNQLRLESDHRHQTLLLAIEDAIARGEEDHKGERMNGLESQHVEKGRGPNEIFKMCLEISQLTSAIMGMKVQMQQSKARFRGNTGGRADLSQLKTTGIPTPATSQSPPSLDSATRFPTPASKQSPTLQEPIAVFHRKDVVIVGGSQSCGTDTLPIVSEHGDTEGTFLNVGHSSIHQFLDLEAESRINTSHESSNVTRVSSVAFGRSQSNPALPSGDDLLSASASHWPQVSLSESVSESNGIEDYSADHYLLNDPFSSPICPRIHERVFKIRRDDPTPLSSPSYDDMPSLGEFSQFRSFLSDNSSASPLNCWTPASETVAEIGNCSFTRIHEGFRPLSSSWLKRKPTRPEKLNDNQGAKPKASQYLSMPSGNHDHRLCSSPSFTNVSQALPALPSNDCLLAVHDSTFLSPFASVLVWDSKGRKLRVDESHTAERRRRSLPARVSDLFNPA